MIELHDKVKLKDGRIGFVVFVLDDKNFMIEITSNHEVVTVSDKEIAEILEDNQE